ncbi:hypothetical protein TNCT_20671 [Trichonephila clavata]|uniref:Uncharacterized protein n=1 Tax=Trichonephila clavata TaxID=2740835 RepID=A0A8X6FKG7_TRICU|nr:hypothetical protein TNCT_552211 [Trichonephila clavata]GFQ81299.1 hypothetical protein TNCT_20671 [Trichonephila clavata]
MCDTLRLSILNAVSEEMQRADHCVTRQTIHLRVLKRVADILELSWINFTDSKSICIHPNDRERIDDIWKECLQGNLQPSHDELNAYEKLKSVDHVNVIDLAKFISILARKYVIERDPTNKEKILRSNDLNILLAVDGFCGYCPNDLKNYINNLKYANDGDKHINAVREMYNLEILRNLSGTDASCIVFLALLTIYKKSIKDDQAILILENVISNVRNYLMKNAQFYGDIANAVNNINELIEFYEFAIDPCEMEKISTMKIVDIINKSKKKKNITFVKRGRKKNDYEPTKKRKIVMPLNSDSEQE